MSRLRRAVGFDRASAEWIAAGVPSKRLAEALTWAGATASEVARWQETRVVPVGAAGSQLLMRVEGRADVARVGLAAALVRYPAAALPVTVVAADVFCSTADGEWHGDAQQQAVVYLRNFRAQNVGYLAFVIAHELGHAHDEHHLLGPARTALAAALADTGPWFCFSEAWADRAGEAFADLFAEAWTGYGRSYWRFEHRRITPAEALAEAGHVLFHPPARSAVRPGTLLRLRGRHRNGGRRRPPTSSCGRRWER